LNLKGEIMEEKLFDKNRIWIVNNDIEEDLTDKFSNAIESLSKKYIIESDGYCLRDDSGNSWNVKHMSVQNRSAVCLTVSKYNNV
jgi:hypothetical protein